MAVAALVLFVVWVAIAFGLRTVVQLRRTGDTGFRGLSGVPGSIAWWAGVLFVVALIAGAAAPVAGLLGLRPFAALDRDLVAGIGAMIAGVGVLLTFAAQLDMGDNWRIGVDPKESTSLVVGGWFRVVRNPIFSAMALTALGLAVMVPNVIAVVGAVALIAALELQVRLVEEPYLKSAHGHDYGSYAASVGRFVPGVGRLDRSVAQ